MLTDAGSSAGDREARNEHLSDIDETWEVCRELVDLARNAYEDALEVACAECETAQAGASEVHREAIGAAWEVYKKDVRNTPGMTRRDAITEARATYNKAALEVRAAFDRAMSVARDGYARSLQDARLEYEVAIEGAFEAHRKAIEKVRQYLAPSNGDESLDVLSLAGEHAARLTQGSATDVNVLESHDEEDPDRIAESLLSSLNGSS